MTCRSFKSQRVKAIFKSIHMISQTLMRVKNRMPEDIKTGVVYKIPCRDCEHVYVDESKRTLKKQIAKHKQAVRI